MTPDILWGGCAPQVRNTGSLQEAVEALLQQVCSTQAVQQLLDPGLQGRLSGLQAAILKQQQQALHHLRELDRLRQTRSELAQVWAPGFHHQRTVTA
jgi:dTDP-4-amino-4,6-dideoxygalactose transaminase